MARAGTAVLVGRASFALRINLLLSSVGRGVCHGVTRRDTTRHSIHDVRFRATAAISVPGGSWHTRSYRDQVRAAPLLSDAVAGSVTTTRCVWPEFAILLSSLSDCKFVCATANKVGSAVRIMATVHTRRRLEPGLRT